MIRQEEVYKIGKIGKPHGVKGELTFFFDDDVFDRVDADYLVLCIDGILVPFFMEEWRFKSGETALVKFCDIDSKEAASELTGCEVFFPKHLSGNTEFISAISCKNTCMSCQCFFQNPCYPYQCPVSFNMTICIINPFKIIKINHQKM